MLFSSLMPLAFAGSFLCAKHYPTPSNCSEPRTSESCTATDVCLAGAFGEFASYSKIKCDSKTCTETAYSDTTCASPTSTQPIQTPLWTCSDPLGEHKESVMGFVSDASGLLKPVVKKFGAAGCAGDAVAVEEKGACRALPPGTPGLKGFKYKCGDSLTQCTYSTADCADGSELDCVPATALPKLDECMPNDATTYKVTC